MAELKAKVELALEEARILAMGSSILLGAQYQAVLQSGFGRLPTVDQFLHLLALGLTLLAFGLIMAPVPRHLLVEGVESTRGTHGFTTRASAWALLPFAVALAIVVLVSADAAVGRPLGPYLGAFFLLSTLALWYGPALLLRRPKNVGGPAMQSREDHSDTPDERAADAETADLETKIRHALIEVRMVLPGAQAMFAFQALGTFTEAFDKLPASSKYVHLASLACVAGSIALLMAPASFHRLAERGATTRRQHRITGASVVAAMALLAPGMTGDLFVVVRRVTGSDVAALAAAVPALLLLCGLWFLPVLLRRTRPRP